MNHWVRIRNLAEEARRIGPRAFRYRVWMELQKKFGLDVKRHPIKPISLEDAKTGIEDKCLDDPDTFKTFKARSMPSFFSTYPEEVKQWQTENLDEAQRANIIDKGRRAARGKILAFQRWEADFSFPPDWHLNPVTGARWPDDRHAKRTLNKETRERCGDIKNTWEIGRFLHIPAILRAYALTEDDSLIDDLFVQIDSFREANPLNQGVHWVSEQEVGIRACMLAYALYFLMLSERHLTAERVKSIYALLIASAEYCAAEIGFARHCIANNHFIAGILGIYVPAYLLPWHPKSKKWIETSRAYLFEALDSQWQPDGGYIQPAHNYHRLAIDYLLWTSEIAELLDDHELMNRIREKLKPAFHLLNSMIDEDTGRLPNWGPNDGALFGPWSECDYADFRPVLNSLSKLLFSRRQYDEGPWDEHLLWLGTEVALESEVDHQPPGSGSFPHTGLHCFRQKTGRAIFRCGPITSRYGQQADQLHLDLWWKGRNILHDAGSYSYASTLHEWFRGTHAHNTVVVGNKSQMEPYRQFLFLKWPEVHTLDLGSRPEGVRRWVGGLHNGYLRLPQKVIHGRVLMELGEACWLVADLLGAHRYDPPVTCDLMWNAPDCAYELEDKALHMNVADDSFTIAWSNEFDEVSAVVGSENPPRGWTSRYYGMKKPSLSLQLTKQLTNPMMLVTWLGPKAFKPNLKSSGLIIGVGDVQIDMSTVWTSFENSGRFTGKPVAL